ncbi:MAG: hypothetical protein ACQESB_05490 [Elusimicrobiota bacterium]
MDKIISKESLIKKLVCFKALFLLAALLFVSADFTRAAFMDYGIGTRGGGKSGAFITTADDSSAGEWNVAALLNVSGFDAMFEYYSPFTNLPNVSINHSYGAGAYGINDNMSAGASYMAFDGDSIYKSESYRVSFAAGNYDFIDFPFAAGVSLKYLSHSFFFDKGEQQDIEDPDINGSESAGDFTLDAGILLEPVFDMPVGISVKNILPADVGIYNEDIVPL